MPPMPFSHTHLPLSRRHWLQLAGAGLLPAGLQGTALAANSYPSGPVTLVVPFSAGGQFDSIGRAVATAMAADLGKPMIVENVGGAGGTIAAGKVVRARPDGQTLLLFGGNLASARALYKTLDYDPLEDLQPITRLSLAPHVVMASPRSGITSFKQLQDKVKAGARLSYGSPGVGTSMHLTFELIKQHYHLDILHAPYKGGSNVMNDLIAGNIDLGIIAVGPALSFIRSNKVLALGVTSKARSPVAPQIPAFAEMGFPQLDAGSWAGLSAPKVTPQAIVERLNRSATKALANADVRRMFDEQGFMATPGTAQEMREYATRDAQVFDPVLRSIQL